MVIRAKVAQNICQYDQQYLKKYGTKKNLKYFQKSQYKGK